MRLNHVCLPCADVARAMAFYQGLGLVLIVLERGPDGAPQYARLLCPDGDATLSLEQADAPASPGRARLYFECSDLDRRVSELGRAGVSFASPPQTKPWLWREAELVDPDGNQIRLYQAGSYRLDPPWRLPRAWQAPDAEAAATGRDADAGEIEPFLVARNRGYLEAPIPSARDQEIAGVLERLMAGGAEARDRAASRLGPDYTGTLLAFAERMATRAARERSDRPVLLGLVAVGLVWRAARDVRPAIPVLALLHDAAARAGGDPAALFGAAGALAPPDAAPVFHDFLTRPDLDGIAEQMGFSAGRDRDGFRYRRLWGAGEVVESDSDGPP